MGMLSSVLDCRIFGVEATPFLLSSRFGSTKFLACEHWHFQQKYHLQKYLDPLFCISEMNKIQ